MTSTNDITKDKQQTKPSSQQYLDNYDRIFKGKKMKQYRVSQYYRVVIPVVAENKEGAIEQSNRLGIIVMDWAGNYLEAHGTGQDYDVEEYGVK